MGLRDTALAKMTIEDCLPDNQGDKKLIADKIVDTLKERGLLIINKECLENEIEGAWETIEVQSFVPENICINHLAC